MTRDDIAATLAYCVEHCDNDQELEVVRWVTEKFSERLFPLAEHRPQTVWRRRAQFAIDAKAAR